MMDIPQAVHLCCPPAKAEVSDFWQCTCGRDWLFVNHLAASVPDWVRINIRIPWGER